MAQQSINSILTEKQTRQLNEIQAHREAHSGRERKGFEDYLTDAEKQWKKKLKTLWQGRTLTQILPSVSRPPNHCQLLKAQRPQVVRHDLAQTGGCLGGHEGDPMLLRGTQEMSHFDRARY